MHSDNKLPAKSSSTDLDTEIARSRVIWWSGFALLIVVVILFKQTAFASTGLSILFGIGLLVVSGLGFSYFAYLQHSVQNQVAEGKFAAAEKTLRLVLPLQKLLAPIDPATSTDFLLLSRICREREQLSEAEKHAAQALIRITRVQQSFDKNLDDNVSSAQSKPAEISRATQRLFMEMHADALYEMAAVQYDQGKQTDAERTLKEALKELDGSLSGKDQFRYRRYQSAANVLRLLSLIYQYGERFDEEERALLKANEYLQSCIAFLNEQPEAQRQQPDSYFKRGCCHLKLGMYEKAITDFNMTTVSKPPLPLKAAAICNRGECHNRMGTLDLAMNDFNEVLELQPKNCAALINRAELFDKLGYHQKASADKALAAAQGYKKSRLDLFPADGLPVISS